MRFAWGVEYLEHAASRPGYRPRVQRPQHRPVVFVVSTPGEIERLESLGVAAVGGADARYLHYVDAGRVVTDRDLGSHVGRMVHVVKVSPATIRACTHRQQLLALAVGGRP